MANFRSGKATGTVTWSDGTLFNGYLLVGFKGLIDGAAAVWPSLSRSQFPKRTLPVWRKVPIIDGAFLPVGVLYNADLTPHNSQYIAYYYDLNDKQIAGPTAAFTVAAETFTPPAATLTAPSQGSNPTPDS